MADERKALWAKCKDCGRCWVAAYYPDEAGLVGRVAEKNSNCPECGGTGMLARQKNGVLLEAANMPPMSR